MRVEAAEAAVGPSGHAHAVPQPGVTQVLLDHIGAAVQLVVRVSVQVAALANVVDLRGGGGACVG